MKLALGLSGGITALIFGSAVMLLMRADTWALAPFDWAAVRFTVLQAALSAFISCAVAVPLARALFRQRFWGRDGLILLMSAPFVLPVVVAILGILSIFGRGGPINALLDALGLPAMSIFGLHGVVLASVFFNLPLATRMLLQGWHSIPIERFQLAQSLSMPEAMLFRHLEWPMLRGQLMGIFAAIFLICLTSFAIALTLGGGPRASTIELAIYQALRYEFDLGRAALLAVIQFGLCAAMTLVAVRFSQDSGLGVGMGRRGWIGATTMWRSAMDVGIIAVAALFLVSPMLAALARGMLGLFDLPQTVWPALARSVFVAMSAALLAITAALVLVLAPRRQGWISFAAMLPFATSGLVLGTGLFLILRPVVSPSALALPMAITVNALMSLPFLFRILLPATREMQVNYARLTSSLGLPMWSRLRLVILPILARPIGYGAGLAAALSMGDLGVIALFADDGTATLPLMVQRLMAAYRMDAAAGVALILVAATALIFFTCDALGRKYAET